MNLKLFDEISVNSKQNQIVGLGPYQWKVLYEHHTTKNKNVFVFPSTEEAEEFYDNLLPNQNILFFPDFDEAIYSSIAHSFSDALTRFKTLSYLCNETEAPITLVTSIKALTLYVPAFEFFKKNTLDLSISDIISPDDLKKQLVSLGYQSAITVEERGYFSHKGEIFDIYPTIGPPIRINYFDDMIETINEISTESRKTIKDSHFEKITIYPTPLIFLNKEYHSNLRANLPRFGPEEKHLNLEKQHLFNRLSDGVTFEDFFLLTSLFVKEKCTLKDLIERSGFKSHFINLLSSKELLEEKFDQLLSDEKACQNEKELIKPNLERIYKLNSSFECHFDVCPVQIHQDLSSENLNTFFINSETLLPGNFKHQSEKIAKLKNFFVKNNIKNIFCYYLGEKNKESLTKIFNEFFNDIRIDFVQGFLDKGFYYKNEKTVYLSFLDLISQKKYKTKKASISQSLDLFADQLATLKEGDYVVHKDHGVGKYLGIETLELSGITNDYLVIEYKDQDKVYLPVYKMNLIQKYSDDKTSPQLSNLKTTKFDQAKTKAKSAIKKLAFDLLEVQAKRATIQGYSFSPPDDEFLEFENQFSFKETIDQQQAINDILSDMQSSQPMDRLVCGDVGFGKTEVAMRAAFKAVLDHKQVAILVPTTVLAFQHYNSFIERFKKFAINIEFISRFKTTKESNEILKKTEEGNVDILIGTHKILSPKLKFKDLGLIIIDEEQRFGVGHKEKLKLLRESIDTLTLTATPIPRTLQMSFLGIKELSLIKTPPPKRQSIKSYIIKDDPSTIKQAIEKELNRGGQVFIVHNKVNDIELFTDKIRQLVPTARIIFAHGQLPEKELEKRIIDFYQYKYDILISTTIIESGIDIPRANTMIIDRADHYGLSQLHQLRGRIGRSDKKAYAYFMLPRNFKLSEIATKRLKAIQDYADMGSGFALATSDLEIRGSGDILGPEQSGHIATVGLELYMELLQDAIQELKGAEAEQKLETEILTNFSSFIPKEYIENSGLRLKYYKKLSQAKSKETIEDLVEEIQDQFGKPPVEFKNLTTILNARLFFARMGIKSVKVRENYIDLYFNQDKVEKNESLQSAILNFFMKRPKIYKFNQNYSINCYFKEKVTTDTLLDFSKYIAEQILPC